MKVQTEKKDNNIRIIADLRRWSKYIQELQKERTNVHQITGHNRGPDIIEEVRHDIKLRDQMKYIHTLKL